MLELAHHLPGEREGMGRAEVKAASRSTVTKWDPGGSQPQGASWAGGKGEVVDQDTVLGWRRGAALLLGWLRWVTS